MEIVERGPLATAMLMLVLGSILSLGGCGDDSGWTTSGGPPPQLRADPSVRWVAVGGVASRVLIIEPADPQAAPAYVDIDADVFLTGIAAVGDGLYVLGQDSMSHDADVSGIYRVDLSSGRSDLVVASDRVGGRIRFLFGISSADGDRLIACTESAASFIDPASGEIVERVTGPEWQTASWAVAADVGVAAMTRDGRIAVRRFGEESAWEFLPGAWSPMARSTLPDRLIARRDGGYKVLVLSRDSGGMVEHGLDTAHGADSIRVAAVADDGSVLLMSATDYPSTTSFFVEGRRYVVRGFSGFDFVSVSGSP